MYCSRKRENGMETAGTAKTVVSAAKKQYPKGLFTVLALLPVLLFQSALPVRCTAADPSFLSEREREIIVRAVAAECPDASYGVQVGLAGVILRRLESGRYGNDAACVVYAAGFLHCTESGRIAGSLPEDALVQAEHAVETALRGGDPTDGALYFATPENHMTPPTRITYREGGYIFGKR
ncbi:MAG: cell wall hydrolase [Clostridia bacterium]|nr:cell wall hydrolase [Clostridia bacterium]